MAMNRQDYIDQGIRDRAAGLPDTKGYSSWQEKAWREGYDSASAVAAQREAFPHDYPDADEACPVCKAGVPAKVQVPAVNMETGEKISLRLPVKVVEAIQQDASVARRALEKALPSATAKHLDFLAAEQTREFKKARPNPRRIQRLADKVETLTRKYMRRMCS